MSDSLTRALGMIGAYTVDRAALLAGEVAFENTFGRARAAGLDQQAAFDEAEEARRRAVRAHAAMPRLANDNDPIETTLHALGAALNPEPVA